MSSSASVITLLVLTCLYLRSHAHVFRVGDCPKVEVMNDFSMKKFLGTWYVIQKFRTSSDCFAENITTSHDEYFITEKLEPLGVKM
jgi:lipocalin